MFPFYLIITAAIKKKKHVILRLDRSIQFLLDSPVKPGNDDFKVFTKEFIRKATHPHPCPLPSRERGLKNRPSLDGRGLRGGCLNVSLLMNSLVSLSDKIHLNNVCIIRIKKVNEWC